MTAGAPARPTPHLLHVFPSFRVGGAQNGIIKVAQALRDKYRHTLIALDGNFDAAADLNEDRPFSFENFPVVKSATISISNLVRARSLLRRLQPDLLLTYNWGAIEWALANRLSRRCPHLHLESGFGPDESAERQLWRRAKFRRVLLSRCDRIVVPSLVLQEIAGRIWQFPAGKVSYLPNGIDCCRFARGPDKELIDTLGIPDKAMVVGTIAVLRREKNLLRLVRIFAALLREVDAWLVVVGDGPEREALAQAATNMDISSRLILAGAIANPERILGRFDAFALTSDTEQMPYSILEAMAAGLAVAATDVGDVRHMLASENADFIVPIDDEASMTRGLLRLLQDPALRARIGRANQERVGREYTLEQMVDRYDALFRVTLSGPGGL
jgi:L-malate glycosyltransferase